MQSYIYSDLLQALGREQAVGGGGGGGGGEGGGGGGGVKPMFSILDRKSVIIGLPSQTVDV